MLFFYDPRYRECRNIWGARVERGGLEHRRLRDDLQNAKENVENASEEVSRLKVDLSLPVSRNAEGGNSTKEAVAEVIEQEITNQENDNSCIKKLHKQFVQQDNSDETKLMIEELKGICIKLSKGQQELQKQIMKQHKHSKNTSHEGRHNTFNSESCGGRQTTFHFGNEKNEQTGLHEVSGRWREKEGRAIAKKSSISGFCGHAEAARNHKRHQHADRTELISRPDPI